ncbi:serine/threonine-protein kinase 36 [Protopterus annectens]|uniref:serine/threonine-protein kinase 36 n=1 Tax=Protopterus annectens TaxID=7888 RepID=UPI001CFA58DB|nr:serine/threonine-protein kinase 36 [Protopterus annectens]
MEKYHVLEMIGEGSFGRVYKGRKKFSAQVVALKFIPKVGRSERELKNLKREIDIMRGLKHPNIVQMLDSFETDKEVVVVTDYAEGELFQILEDDGSLPEEQVQDIACQLISALFYLHSHRILHRDMKPQNILLGKGGIVKLCDFGFARAMSINTLVLTSIKGTPLYMSPELVEEKPYDHTADLWSVGCILYELFVGTPPFYTNSIFQLVSLIIKDPVKWPKNMSPDFKNFLQGLLTKDPRQRLSWPALLHHPFVAGRVTVVDDTVGQGIESPFTVQLPPEMQAKKEQQAEALAPKSGQSKILKKARQKMAQEAQKKEQNKKPQALASSRLHPEVIQNKTEQSPARESCAATSRALKFRQAPAEITVVDKTLVDTVKPSPAKQRPSDLSKWNRNADWEVEQTVMTPRSHSISQDYAREFPEGKVGRRAVTEKSQKMKPDTHRSIQNVDLDNEEVDSDDEWQHFIEATEPSNLQLTIPLTLLSDQTFIQRIRSRLKQSSSQVADGMLEGASRLRPALHVIGNLLATRCDLDLLYKFCQDVEAPHCLLHLIEQIVDSAVIKQQPWCITLLSDLTAVMGAYFASDFNHMPTGNGDSFQVFEQSIRHFLGLLGKLLSLPMDNELKLREQAAVCLICLCESLDRNPGLSVSIYPSFVAEYCPVLDIILSNLYLDQRTLKTLEGTLGDAKVVKERGDQVVGAITAALAALISVPPGAKGCTEPKAKISVYLAEKLLSNKTPKLTQMFLQGLRTPLLAISVLKVLYACCHVSHSASQTLAGAAQDMESILFLIQGKVPMPDLLQVQVVEVCLHLLSLLMIQLQSIPPQLEGVLDIIISLFLESRVTSHVGAAALLLVQLSSCGLPVELKLEEFLSATNNALTSPAQLYVVPPMEFGAFDGLLVLLMQMLMEGDLTLVREFTNSELWSAVWHRFAVVLQVSSDRVIMEGETPRPNKPTPEPDWMSISPSGMQVFLSLVLLIFTKEPLQCVHLLTSQTTVAMTTLTKLLAQDFLQHLSSKQNSQPTQKDRAIGDNTYSMVLHVCQIMCVPFAVDVAEEMLNSILEAFEEYEVMVKLVQICVHHLPLHLSEIPMSLQVHLILSNNSFIVQFVTAACSDPAKGFLSSILLSDYTVLVTDLLCLLSHVARASSQYVPFLISILEGPNKDYAPLKYILCHHGNSVRAKACGFIGNLLKHGSNFSQIFLQQPGPLEKLIECLADKDDGVRKSASFAVGNAAFHDSSLLKPLGPAIPWIAQLLSDPQTKTRCNAAAALGNLGAHSAEVSMPFIKAQVPHLLLNLACHDSQSSVQEAALIALRTLSQQPKIHQVLMSLKASEKLSTLSQSTPLQNVYGSPRPRSAVSASSVRHCAKLIETLRPTRTALK